MKRLGVVGLTKNLLEKEKVRKALERLSINPKGIEKEVESGLYTNVWFYLKEDKIQIVCGVAFPYTDVKDLAYLVERGYPILYLLNPRTQWEEFVKVGKSLDRDWFVWDSGDGLDWDLFERIETTYKKVPELLGLIKKDNGRFVFDAEVRLDDKFEVMNITTRLNEVFKAYKKELDEKENEGVEVNKLDELAAEVKKSVKKLIEYLENSHEVECYSVEYYKNSQELKIQADIYQPIPELKMVNEPIENRPDEAIVRFYGEGFNIWDIWELKK